MTTHEQPRIKNGWHKDIPNAAYHGSEGWSSSQLKTLTKRTPAHLQQQLVADRNATAAQALGTAVHGLVLEPDNFYNDCAVAPDVNKRTKAGRAEWELFSEENKGKTILTAAQFETAQIMAANILMHPVAKALLQKSVNESSVFWDYADEGQGGEVFSLPFKCRPDAIASTVPALIDIKTCQDASHHAMQRTILNFGYHFSAAMYLDGVNACPALLDHFQRHRFENFVLICVENEAPYQVACYDLSDDWLHLGRAQYRQAAWKLHKALTQGFTGYPNKLRVIDMPPYAERANII